jgi:hypothetical protein
MTSIRRPRRPTRAASHSPVAPGSRRSKRAEDRPFGRFGPPGAPIVASGKVTLNRHDRASHSRRPDAPVMPDRPDLHVPSDKRS